MKIIDTHSHITCDALYERIDEIIENAQKANVERILCVCCSKEEIERAIELAQRYDFIDCAYGYHPEDVDKINDPDLVELETILKNEHIVALGEIGLDYYWVQDNKDAQKNLFIKQIELANRLELPILIHMRDATLDTLEILKAHPTMALFHCYSGSVETSKQIFKMGYYVSFAGPLTFKNARDSVEVCRQAPLDRIFVETDAPYLSPHPLRGTQNEPANVVHTFNKVCEIKEMDPQRVADQMKINYQTLFKKA